MLATAVAAAVCEVSTSAPMPSEVVVTALMLPDTTPLLPLLLTNTEKPCAEVRPATPLSRLISLSTSANSEFSVVREVDVVCPEAACVASVPSRSRSFETLSSAPSLICRSDRPSLALRTPWLRMATVER